MNARNQRLTTLAVALLVLTVPLTFTMAEEEQVEETDAVPPVVIGVGKLVLGLVTAFIGGAVVGGGTVLYWDSNDSFNQSDEAIRNVEASIMYETFHTAIPIYANSMENYANIWPLTSEHFVRQAELASASYWNGTDAYDSSMVLNGSGVYINNSVMMANASEHFNEQFEAVSETIKKWGEGEAAEYYGEGKMQVQFWFAGDSVAVDASDTMTAKMVEFDEAPFGIIGLETALPLTYGELVAKGVISLPELVDAFDIAGISKSPAIFDIDKLTYFNATYLRAMAPEDFAKAAEPYIRQGVKNPAIDTAAVAALLQARCEKLTEIPEKVDFFDALPDYDVALFTNKKSKTDSEVSARMLQAAIPALEALPQWTQDAVHDCLISLAESLGVKNATLMWPVRIAAAGKQVTPGGAVEICHILGKEETLRRLRLGLSKLQA